MDKNKKLRVCIHEDCDIRVLFNYEGEKKGIYCSTHKKNGMQDIKHKKCREESCKTRPNLKR
jgi:hypothetical protein